MKKIEVCKMNVSKFTVFVTEFQRVRYQYD